MSLSQTDLATIQKAGQAVHKASETIASSLRSQAAETVASIATQPFEVESEQTIASFKVLSRLNQGLIAVEAQLRELYAAATELTNPTSQTAPAGDLASNRKSKKAVNAGKRDKTSIVKKLPKVRPYKKKQKGTANGALTPNDLKLLQYLQQTLKLDEWTAQTGAAMASGSGLPLGSVGLSVKKVLASGAVKAGSRGMYQLTPTDKGSQVEQVK